jgi:hypothetical protein
MSLGNRLPAVKVPRVFENRVLREMFAPKRDEVSRGWRKLHSEELYCW